MNLLAIILCKNYCLIDCSSSIPMSTIVALVGVAISLIGLYLNLRSQTLSSLNSKLSEMAKECYRDIELDKETDEKGKTIPPTHAIIETIQNISHTVSTIIFARQYLNNRINKNIAFVLWINKRSCIDKFFIQLHSSTIDFIMNKGRHKVYISKNKDKDIDQLYHIMVQVIYCKEWFERSYKKLGNATPTRLQKKIGLFKKISNKEEKIEGLDKLIEN